MVLSLQIGGQQSIHKEQWHLGVWAQDETKIKPKGVER